MAAASRRAASQITKQTQIRATARGCRDLQGDVIESAHGRHLERSRCWKHWQRHGSVDIGSLAGLPHDLLAGISGGDLAASDPRTWAFLDTETTGLAGGSGTCAFLTGIGRISERGFELRQFFMRDFAEEASQLHAVAEALRDAEVVVTYNGKAFD